MLNRLGPLFMVFPTNPPFSKRRLRSKESPRSGITFERAEVIYSAGDHLGGDTSNSLEVFRGSPLLVS